MRILLISSYELGRQPLHVASPAAALRRAGHEVAALDLAVEEWDERLVAWADVVACSVYMHTSMRLAVEAARRVRADHPHLPLAVYGLYAPVSRDAVVGPVVDRAFAGEYEPALLGWVEELASGTAEPSAPGEVTVHLGRSDFDLPARDLLPPLDRYAHLDTEDGAVLVGAVEASHGCNQQCRHCPVPAVYGGRTQVVDVDLVMADVAQLVAAGAGHITFGDPDFLSGPAHARRVVSAFGEQFPGVSFDITTKVEHVLAHPDLWPAFAEAGCRFVVSAVECLDDSILEYLDKGHTAAMAAEAMRVLQSHGIEPHPSFLPFTPWTTAAGVLDILDFVADHDLVPNVDPVQYSLRLLLPQGSLLLERPELAPFLDAYDAEALTYRWRAADPALDALWAELSAFVEAGSGSQRPVLEQYLGVRALVAEAAGVPDRAGIAPEAAAAATRVRARLSEPWFCCAEPTQRQYSPVRPGA